MRAAIVGGGVIGSGWAARFLLNGWDVAVFDPGPEARLRLNRVLDNARRSLPALYDRVLPAEGALACCDSIAAAAAGAGWIQESVPERLELKRDVLAEIQRHAPEHAVLASSTSGFKPSDLQQGSPRPDPILVCHPFNPVYLLPLVEVVPSPATDPSIRDRAVELLRAIGMQPLLIRAEIDGHVADRLLEAAWRESLWLVRDGVATTAEIDDAIRYGFGLRWAQMGLFETYRIAGGDAGMKHFIAQFGPALQWNWSRLTDVPELTGELVERIAEQSDRQSGAHDVCELERLRDDNLVAILRALKRNDDAAGRTVAAHEHGLPHPESGEDSLPVTVSRQVPASWTDYNSHVNETHYLEVFAQASDRTMELIGADADYVATGRSYFTVESHLRHLGELRAGDRIRVTTQLLGGDGRKLHLFHRLEDGAGRLAATGEHLLLHVDLHSRRTCPPEAPVTARLADLFSRHAHLPLPDGAGRHVGQSR
ncbi:MAG: carnitine 3-dehydrogenase [Spirochaetaceae bacterium]|nr:carnitine 3-dehydrogenase [Spirochaetaceae bacterium]